MIISLEIFWETYWSNFVIQMDHIFWTINISTVAFVNMKTESSAFFFVRTIWIENRYIGALLTNVFWVERVRHWYYRSFLTAWSNVSVPAALLWTGKAMHLTIQSMNGLFSARRASFGIQSMLDESEIRKEQTNSDEYKCEYRTMLL